MIGPATHFTSHAWAFRFADLVDALKGDVGATDEHGATCYFWLDLFVVPQRAPVTPPQVRPTSSIFPSAAPPSPLSVSCRVHEPYPLPVALGVVGNQLLPRHRSPALLCAGGPHVG